ncbi:ABC transporter permease [Candidatus Aerophobetes bacterium]|nr:ABC transporter permease [Candidatus Aerophobetes bacterium]
MARYGFFSRQLKKAFGDISASNLAIIGIVIVGIFAIIAIFAPFFAPYNPYDIDLMATYQSPSFEHLFGTDNVGRDTFSRILYGSRMAFTITLLIVILELSISVPLGLISSYIGGYFDEIIMRIMDIIISIPHLLLAIVIVALLGPNVRNAILAIGISYIPMLTRLVRSVTLSIKEEPYIEACQVLRFSVKRIVFYHILPNIVSVIIVQVSLDLGYALIDMASLSFIGLGVQPPKASWGAMLSTGKNYLLNTPWMCIFPGIAIALLVFGFNLFGIGLERILNPRYQKY